MEVLDRNRHWLRGRGLAHEELAAELERFLGQDM